MNKYLILSVFFFFITSKISAQEADARLELDSLALKMFTDTNKGDFGALLDMTHPALFDLVPRETMLTIIKSTFEGTDEFSIELSKKVPEYKISAVFKDEENNTDYAFVSYNMNMNMTFHNETFDDEAKETMINLMKLQDMHVAFISNNSLDIEMANRITIMIKDDVTNNKWALINYDPNSPLFYQILSKTVLEKAKDYYQNLMIENKKNN